MSKNNGPKWGKQIAWWGVGITACCLFASKVSVWNEARELESRKKAAQARPLVKKEQIVPTKNTAQQAVPQEIKCWINEKGQRFCSNVVPPQQPEAQTPAQIAPHPTPQSNQPTAKQNAMNFLNAIPKDIATGILCGLVFIIACFFYLKSYDKPQARKIQQKQCRRDNLDQYFRVDREDKKESLEMRQLLHMLLHDRKAAERLIAYEKELDPSLNREECIREAIARIRRDQRG